MPDAQDFSHDDDSKNTANGESEDNGKRKDICRDYLNNICSRGNRCKFYHPEENIEKSQNAADEPYQFCIDLQKQCYHRENSIPLDFKNKLADRMECFMRELETEATEVTSEEQDEKRKRSPKRSRKVKQPFLKKQHSLAKRRIRVIPETPEKKDSQCEIFVGKENDVIEQTPIGKIHASGPKSNFAHLLRREEERFSQMIRAKRSLSVSLQSFENLGKQTPVGELDGDTTLTMPKRAKQQENYSNCSSSISLLNKRLKRRLNNSSTKSPASSVLSFPFSRNS